MQYFKPDGERFTGDCMPFFHDGVFRLFYLVDEGHHAGLGGVGGHQWAQSSTRDLKTWEHHPMALPITDPREGSMCTGSVFFHEGVYHAFYATRFMDMSEHLSHAVSDDGVRFTKIEPNPFAAPPSGWSARAYRDPFVFRDPADGVFHMLVTARLDAPPLPGRGGMLAHLVSHDLYTWTLRGPFLQPGLAGTPECADHFFWNGWHYLIFSNNGIAYYRMARNPLGPWLTPAQDMLDSPASRVMKTAAFIGGRRIGAAWLGTREGDTDNGRWQFGGHGVLRELVQHSDGTLGTAFVPELTPVGTRREDISMTALGTNALISAGTIDLADTQGLAAARLDNMPRDWRIQVDIAPQEGSAFYGLALRATDSIDSSCDLSFSPAERIVRLGNQMLTAVAGLDRSLRLQIVATGDIIDVCINNRRTLINRCPEKRGETLLLYARNGDVAFNNLEIYAL